MILSQVPRQFNEGKNSLYGTLEQLAIHMQKQETAQTLFLINNHREVLACVHQEIYTTVFTEAKYLETGKT